MAAGCCGRSGPITGASARQPAQRAYSAVAAAIARFEPVSVGASAQQYAAARAALPSSVRVLELSSDDAWMRDVGPSFVVNADGAVRGVQWRFNAWGGLYRDCRRDQAVAQKVLELADCDRYCAPLINEGGAIHVDGQGTVLVTEQCLLKRNPYPEPGADRERAQALPGREPTSSGSARA